MTVGRVQDTSDVAAELEGLPARHFGARLTAQERVVLVAALLGKTHYVTAAELGMAESSVKNHLTAAYGKLGASSLLEAGLLSGYIVPAPFGQVEADELRERLSVLIAELEVLRGEAQALADGMPA